MKIETFSAEFESWQDKDRGQIASVLSLLSPPSKATLLNFQRDWDGGRPYDEFVAEQNKLIRGCLEIELSSIGGEIRKMLNLPVLALDTEIPQAECDRRNGG